MYTTGSNARIGWGVSESKRSNPLGYFLVIPVKIRFTKVGVYRTTTMSTRIEIENAKLTTNNRLK